MQCFWIAEANQVRIFVHLKAVSFQLVDSKYITVAPNVIMMVLDFVSYHHIT
jgi:hypothetical protein